MPPLLTFISPAWVAANTPNMRLPPLTGNTKWRGWVRCNKEGLVFVNGRPTSAHIKRGVRSRCCSGRTVSWLSVNVTSGRQKMLHPHLDCVQSSISANRAKIYLWSNFHANLSACLRIILLTNEQGSGCGLNLRHDDVTPGDVTMTVPLILFFFPCVDCARVGEGAMGWCTHAPVHRDL